MKTYTFSSPAFWRPTRAMYGAYEGTLGITDEGRVEYTLKNGKLLFSAPASCMKLRYEGSSSDIRFVVGPRQYTLLFYNPEKGQAFASAAAVLADVASGRPLFADWRKRLQAAASTKPDAEQIIAAASPPSLVHYAKSMSRKSGLITAAGIAFFVGVGVVIGILTIHSDRPLAETKTATYPIVVMLAAGLGFAVLKVNRRRKTTQTPELPPEDMSQGPGDTFPPGTPASGSFGFTATKQVLFGILIVPTIAIGGLLIAGIIQGIIETVSGK